MTRALKRDEIVAAYRAACRLEVRSLKPGNVHVFASGHRMTVADFDRSAEVSAPHIANTTLRVGTRVRRAVKATFDAVGQNTNLGIVLLCAPLAAAAERGGAAPLEEKLRTMLARLGHDDARDVYIAITTANPAGLGEDQAGDVRAEPPANWTLLDAMSAAAPRDMIASEYATGFASIFAAAETYTEHVESGIAPEDALSLVFLCELAARPDTHIVRKHGPDLAARVRNRAQAVLQGLDLPSPSAIARPHNRSLLLQFDSELKVWGANPGSLADLMCASVFVAALKATASRAQAN
jgi:triphosphoribosyl-dephospho-CoA synthase